MISPLGFMDFVRLQRDAACVITDSGTVQEECAIHRVPSVTIRDVTERPETLEAGANMVVGSEPAHIVAGVEMVRRLSTDWSVPSEYLTAHPSIAVLKIILGREARRKLIN